jgi:PAS domain S-box-containing protein
MVSRYRSDPSYVAETKLFTLDGRVVDVLYTASRVGPLAEAGVSLLGVIDISERKQAEEALRRSEQRYQNLFQAMAVGFFEVDYTHSRQKLRSLRDAGITDFRRYFGENLPFVRELMRATRIVDVNERTVELFGRGRKEELLTSGAAFWPEESIQDYIEAVLATIERNEQFSVETRMRRLDGTIFDVHLTLRNVSEDYTRGLVGVVDITARKQAFQALEKSEQRYRHLFNYMPIALQQLDARKLVELFKELRAQGITDLGPYFDAHPDFLRRCMDALVVEEVNEQTVQLLGVRDASELVGNRVGPSWAKTPDTFRRAMESRFRGNTAFQEETQWVTRDGRTVDVLFTSSRLQVGDIGISLVGATDISQRVQAFSALAKSEQRYRHLFHNMPLALWQLNGQRLGELFGELASQGVTDLHAYIEDNPEFVATMIGAMVVEEVNDYAVKMFGARSRDELLGPTNWLWAKSMETPRRAFEGRWRGEEFFQEPTKLMTRDGRVIDALYTVARLRTSEGLPLALASMIDLTEQVHAQEELQRVRGEFAHAARISMLGELTASIAHEVNQPLAAIAAGGEASLRWLTRSTPDVGEVKALTTRIVADARRASDIVTRIRAMATRRAPEQTVLSLDDIIRETLVFLRHEVQTRGATVSHVSALSAKKVMGDRTQLQQVIVNLAINALQAIAHAGSMNRNLIIRTAEHDSASIRCSVEDSGPGIEPQILSCLFDSFFTTKDSGMGMGLRICRSVVEAHGGRIAADNESALGGARFFFTLPVARTTC